MVRKTLILSALLALSTTASADRLLIEKVEAAQQANLPRHGLTMDAVQSRFGEPENRVPAVGEPPITRWVYPEFTVYFEHQYVIDSVTHVRTANAEDSAG